jgi:hypothetical protein
MRGTGINCAGCEITPTACRARGNAAAYLPYSGRDNHTSQKGELELMKNLRVASGIALLVAIVVGAVATAVSVRGVSQTPAAVPAPGIPKSTTAVIADACNACVQASGCDHKFSECSDGCNSTYPPNDPRLARCVASCTRVQTHCVRGAQKTCQACKP